LVYISSWLTWTLRSQCQSRWVLTPAELTRWSHPPLFLDQGIFRTVLQHCEIWHFFTIWLISLEKLNGSLWKSYHRSIFVQGSSPLNFGSIKIRTLDTDCRSDADSPWRRPALSDVLVINGTWAVELRAVKFYTDTGQYCRSGCCST